MCMSVYKGTHFVLNMLICISQPCGSMKCYYFTLKHAMRDI